MTCTTEPSRPTVRPRRQAVKAACAAVLAVVLGAVLLTTAPPATAAGTPVEAVPVAMSPGGTFPYLSDSELARELDTYAAAGATWLRLDMPWSVIESTRGSLVWSRWDKVVDACRSRGIDVLAILAYSPAWARTGTTDHTPPSNPADFATFAGKAAEHFAGRVAAYEIWNEPNIPNFWGPTPSTSAYVALLNPSYRAVKAADPAATVLAGALSPATDSATTISPTTFVTQLYALGAKGSFDALSVHPYSFPALPSDASTSGWNTFYRVTMLRTTMVANGDGAKLIWLTEFGAPTGTSSAAVTETRQRDIIADGFRFARSLGYVGPLFVYSGRDRGSDLTDREQNFGVIRRDFTEKPAMAAVRDAALPAASTATPAPTTSTSTPPAPAAPAPAPTTSTAPAPAPTTSTAPAPAPTTSTAPAPASPVVAAAPAPVSVSAVAATSAAVRWTPGNPGSSAATDFVLQLSRNGGAWTTWSHPAGTASSAVITGLRASASYTVRVALVTGEGPGAWASASFRTARRNGFATTSLQRGEVVTVTRTLTGSAVLRRALRHRSAVVVFDPAGSGRALRVARVTVTRTARVSVRMTVVTSGRLLFWYKLGGRNRVVLVPISVLPSTLG